MNSVQKLYFKKKNLFCIRFSAYFFKVFLFFLQLVSEKLENFEPRATGVLSRSETVQSACSEKEYDAVKRAASKFRLQWNNLNQVRYTRYQLKFNILLFINNTTRVDNMKGWSQINCSLGSSLFHFLLTKRDRKFGLAGVA